MISFRFLTGHRPQTRHLAGGAVWVLCALGASPALFADGPLDKLRIHGYLTQAYAVADGEQFLGIPEGGTFDYRSMALQFRYSITEADTVTVQLSNSRLGDSPLAEELDDIELDWAFYERRFADDRTAVRIGRIPIPSGIYNEIRDVGTVLEFFRPPVGIYFETFSNETLDGLVLSHRFGDWDDWNLEADLYVGEWDRFDSSIPVETITPADVTDAIGGQLWLSTPLEGLRFGLALQSYDVESTGLNGDTSVAVASIDYDRDRFYIRAEGIDVSGQLTATRDYETEGLYLQAGVRIGAWGLNALYETSVVSFEATPTFEVEYDPFYEDFALSATYSWSANMVTKVEIHDASTVFFDAIDGPRDPNQEDVQYGIVSLAVSF